MAFPPGDELKKRVRVAVSRTVRPAAWFRRDAQSDIPDPARGVARVVRHCRREVRPRTRGPKPVALNPGNIMADGRRPFVAIAEDNHQSSIRRVARHVTVAGQAIRQLFGFRSTLSLII